MPVLKIMPNLMKCQCTQPNNLLRVGQKAPSLPDKHISKLFWSSLYTTMDKNTKKIYK